MSDTTPANDRPGPSDDAEDGTSVIGADPDLATDPAETDVEAAPEGGVDDEHAAAEAGTGDEGGTRRP